MLRGLCLVGSLIALMALPESIQAQSRIKVSNIRLGFPLGSPQANSTIRGAFKAGQWTPITADLECLEDTQESVRVVGEVIDNEEAATRISIHLPPMTKGQTLSGEELSLLVIKPGNSYPSVSIRVLGAESGKEFGLATSRASQSLSTASFLVLTVGWPSNSIALLDQDENEQPNAANESRLLRRGWVDTAQVLKVGQLPEQWIGYSAVDLMVLGTANREFWTELTSPAHEKRRHALIEWVQRGGRLVVSAGTNADLLASFKELQEILPATIPENGPRKVAALPFVWAAPSSVSGKVSGVVRFPNGKNEVATTLLSLRGDRPVRTILREFPENAPLKDQRPLAVQGSFGSGRITLIGLDLDAAPFTSWPDRPWFWEHLIDSSGFRLPGIGEKAVSANQEYNELGKGLQRSLDFFEGIPVVSFGWVALFILLYLILIGPLEYLFLKKVLKRLELTWLTFPLIVATVSAAAYLTAHSLKGGDLKINKLDVVDIDLASNRIEGQAWFTLFSPKINDYTLAVEPASAAPGVDRPWAGGTTANALDTVVSWSGNADRRAGTGGGFFSKRYQYHTGTDPKTNRDLYADGLQNVPIQVWTTKAFTGRYSAPLDPAKPLIQAELSVNASDPNVLMGTITSHLPVEEFSDIALVWRDKAYSLSDLPIGVTKSITMTTGHGGGVRSVESDLKSWLTNFAARYPEGVVPPKVTGGRYSSEAGSTSNPHFRLWPILFYESAHNTEIRSGLMDNAGVRRLDQSWRVQDDHPEQAILLLRIRTQEGPAEEMTTSKLSPSRLWVGELPSSGNNRPALTGTLKQETYIRIFIPVKLPTK
jgi:hypothetical protein